MKKSKSGVNRWTLSTFEHIPTSIPISKIHKENPTPEPQHLEITQIQTQHGYKTRHL